MTSSIGFTYFDKLAWGYFPVTEDEKIAKHLRGPKQDPADYSTLKAHIPLKEWCECSGVSRESQLILFRGQFMSLPQIAKAAGMKPSTLHTRLRFMSLEEALSHPVKLNEKGRAPRHDLSI